MDKYNYIVYKTTNILNGYIYIGVHRSKLGAPVKYLGCGVCIGHNSKLMKKGFPQAVKKYGYQNFKRETLFSYPGTELGKIEAYKKEAGLVNKDFLKRKDVYNISLGGKIPINVNCKPCARYDLSGKFIESYNSITEASNKLNISKSNLRRACKKGRFSSGYLWRYFTGDTSDIPPSDSLNKRRVFQFDLLGNYITCYSTLIAASKATNISQASIHGGCSGKHHSAGGFY